MRIPWQYDLTAESKSGQVEMDIGGGRFSCWPALTRRIGDGTMGSERLGELVCHAWPGRCGGNEGELTPHGGCAPLAREMLGVSMV